MDVPFYYSESCNIPPFFAVCMYVCVYEMKWKTRNTLKKCTMCIIFPDFYIIYIHRLTFTIGLRLDEIITEYTVWNGGAQKKIHAIKYILSYAILFHLHYFPLLLLLCITGEVWLRGGSSRVGSRTVWVLCNRPHFFFAICIYVQIHTHSRQWSSDVDEKSAWNIEWLLSGIAQTNKREHGNFLLINWCIRFFLYLINFSTTTQ